MSIRFTGVDASVLPEGGARAPSTTRSVPSSAAGRLAGVRGRRRRRARRRGVRASGARAAGRAVVLPPRRLGAATWEVAQHRASRSSTRSQRLVSGMRALPADAPVGGATAQFLDQRRAIGRRAAARDRPALRVTFVLLYLATRSLVLPLKTLLMNLLTLSATFGILVFVFQDGRFEGLLGYEARERSSSRSRCSCSRSRSGSRPTTASSC